MAFVHGITIRDMSALTAAENRLLDAYANNPGKSFTEIAHLLGMSPRSVAKYGKTIREKLNVNSLAEAVRARGA
jgi:DNA-binding CsgD family transcriptional regulator